MNDTTITKISRKKLDEIKYNKCLQASINYQVYAEIWYLDATAESNWFCYILNDYEAVMPVPFQKIVGFKIISLPTLIQQLGLFYINPVSKTIFNEFAKKIYSNLTRGYSFNFDNSTRYFPKGRQFTNQIINLNEDYNFLFNNFNRNRKRILEKTPTSYTIGDSCDSNLFLKFYKIEYPQLATTKTVHQLEKLMNYSLKNKLGKIITLKDGENLISELFYILSGNRLYQLGAARHKNYINGGSYSLIIAKMIEKYSQKNIKYDFEGSFLKGVHQFNKSYGAINELYTHYSNLKF